MYNNRIRTTRRIACVAALVFTTACLCAGQPLKRNPGKWITGDWHQHTFFTDGSNFMGDVQVDSSASPPTFTILEKYTNTRPDFTPVREGAGAKNEYKGGMAQGFRYGLDFQANSEHGGGRGSRDGFGRFWNVPAFYPKGVEAIPLLGAYATYGNVCSYQFVDSPGCTSPATQVMWRWQELANFPYIIAQYGDNYMSAFDWIKALRGQFRNKQILTGMEWNVPGHEHASTGCLEGQGECIAEFEYRFDRDDLDTTGPALAGLTWNGKILSSAYTTANNYPDYSAVLALNPLHSKTIDGLRWLNRYHRNTSWVNPAHVERAGCGVGGYSIAAFRDMNDTAPTVFFGFEGMPGHQKATNRGEFSASACGGGTFGGAGTYIATVGGMWDNLLADGRKIFNFVSSDFHMTRDDFYPGEYAKTHVKVYGDVRQGGRIAQPAILNGLRSGNSFAVHGDLIDELDFTVSRDAASNLLERGDASATMGETLSARKGETVTVQIRFISTGANNCGLGSDCARPDVHHVQLIQGKVNPTRARKFLSDRTTPDPAFNATDSKVASIVKTFDASSWVTDHDGFTTMTFKVPNVQNDMFFRIRGTNLDYSVAVMDGQGKLVYGTDSHGSPLLNTPGANSEKMAWNDLWFYSNPIFVSVR